MPTTVAVAAKGKPLYTPPAALSLTVGVDGVTANVAWAVAGA
jgi:hypothetical protein